MLLDLNDLNYIYGLIERANITGSEVYKVVNLKLKIINILKRKLGAKGYELVDLKQDLLECEIIQRKKTRQRKALKNLINKGEI